MKITCAKGDGERELFFNETDITGVAAPVNDSTYAADTVFGHGKQIGHIRMVLRV